MILNKYLELLEVQKGEREEAGVVEGGGVQVGNEKRHGVAVQEVGASVRISILRTAMQSCLNQVSPEPRTEPCNV